MTNHSTEIMNQATQDFIRQHQDEDVRQLAFLGSKYPEVNMPFALDQIRGRKMAHVKLPRWASIEGIIYPPHISMEQCSSEQTALYKAELAARLLGLSVSSSENEKECEKASNSHFSKICEFASEGAVDSEFAQNGDTCKKQQILTEPGEDVNETKEEEVSESDFSEEIGFVDLTGGFGVDFSYIASRLGMKSMYVERQAHLCEVAKENFERLGLKNVSVKNGDGIEVLHSFHSKKNAASDSLGITEEQSQSLLKTNFGLKLIFIDPARRDDAGNKVVSLKDCTPDVTVLQEEMLSKADYVIIKLSPMLDWHRAVSELSHVREVHIVSVNNECKELLLVLSARNMGMNMVSGTDLGAKYDENLRIFCINDSQSFVCDETEMASSAVKIASPDKIVSSDRITSPALGGMQYLYEPNASLMKAGCFGVLSERYDAKMLSKNSHLFVSEDSVEAFPGRTFRIIAVSSFNKKELKRQLSGITKANIATRNFPLSVAELRKRLKLKDGGETYIFATTLSDESHVLVICERGI